MIRKIYIDANFKLVIFSLLVLYANNAIALQIDYELEGRIEYTDNATLTSINPISTAIRRASLFADIHDQTESVNYYFRPRISTNNYKVNSLEDSTFYGLDASLSWEIMPEGFAWSFDDYLSQTAIDVRDPLTTFNQQTTNVFLTGPDIILRLGTGKRFEALIRYADFYYEASDIDNERYGGLFRVVSTPSNVSEYSINIESADIRYGENINYENYNRNDAFFEYRGTMRTGNINFISGATKIKRDLSEDLTGFIGKIETQIRTNSHSTFSLYGHAQYTDSSRSFLLSRAYLEGIRTFDTQISADILYEKYLYAGYLWQYELNTFDLSVLKTDQDYEDDSLDAFDRTIDRADIRFDRGITRLTNLFIRGTWSDTYYERTFVDDKDSAYFIGLDYRLSRSFVLRASLGYVSRKSTDITRDYVENSAYISINYSNRQR